MIQKLFSSLRKYSRQKRYSQIQKLINLEIASGFILDPGAGPASFFAALFPKPKRVILVDLSPKLAARAKINQPNIHIVAADAGRLPLVDQPIAASISNSVIGHVDSPDNLAQEMSRVSRSYFLQTPNGRFPLETHSYIAIPFYNYIPWQWLRKSICKLFRANFDYVNSVRYLSETRLRKLFPRVTLRYERVFGLKNRLMFIIVLITRLETIRLVSFE